MGHTVSTHPASDAKPAVANVVGDRLRQLRIEAGLTQQQLAERCRPLGMNIARGTIAKIEAQIRLLKACELFIIAQVLNAPMEKFYPKGFGRPTAKAAGSLRAAPPPRRRSA